MSATVPYTRIEATADGVSRFADADIALDTRSVAIGMPPMAVGGIPSAPGAAYVRSDSFDSALHPAPAGQWVIMLRGIIEVTTSYGDCRRFGQGDLLLTADMAGSGHRSAGIGDAPFEALFIPVDPAWSDS
jgi:hypothetical protein